MIIQIKSPEEIQGFKNAGRLAAEIMSELIAFFPIARNTNQINTLAIELCEKNSVRPIFLGYSGFPAAICASANNAMVHGVPNNEPLVKGDVVSIDLGVESDGYIGDTAVTLVYGQGNIPLVECANESLDAGIKAARAGNKLSDISNAVSNCRGIFSIPKNYGGHGIDRYRLHSDPFIANDKLFVGEDFKLRAGMVIAIEPMLIDGICENFIANDGWTVMAHGLAAHVEHSILVTSGEAYVLTERR